MKELFKIFHLQVFLAFFVTVTLLSLTQVINGDYGIITKYQEAYISIVFIAYTVAVSIMYAKYDSLRLIKGIHYTKSITIVFIFSILPLILWMQQGIVEWLLYIPLCFSIYYLVFEYEYNNYKGNPTFYVGTEALNDRIVRYFNTKTVLGKIWPLWYLAFKIILILIFSKLIKEQLWTQI